MGQTLGATGSLRNDIEDLFDDWRLATADHTVCPREQARLTARLLHIVDSAAYVDETLRTGLSWLKNGLDAQITSRRLRDHERLYGAIPTDAEPPMTEHVSADGHPPVVLTLPTTKRHHRCNGDDAA